jgi:hypothetical protein
MRPAGWSRTFARFQPGPMRLIGPLTVHVVDWSKPRPGRADMVEPRVLDRLSRSHPLIPALVYAPLGIVLAWHAWSAGHPAAAVLALYAFGLLAWSLFEYVAHRVSFHHEPASAGAVLYGYIVHGVHHAYPDDERRWMMPIWVTLPIAGVLYAGFAAALGRYAPAVFAGFLHGYLTYRGRLPTRLGRFLRQYHLAHHHGMPDRHFGVSSPLWDVVFRTR